MSFVNDLILHVIDKTQFVHLFEISISLPDTEQFNDIVKFFDYYIYHISKIDELILQDFRDLSSEYELNVKESEIRSGIYIMKSMALPHDKQIEEKYMAIYMKHKSQLDSIFTGIQMNEKCIFYIYLPKFKNDIIILVSYKEKWLDFIKTNQNFGTLTEIDFIIFFSGYVYVFKSKNPFQNIFSQVDSDNKLFIMYYA